MAATWVVLKHGVDRPGGRRHDRGRLEYDNGDCLSWPDGRCGSIGEAGNQGTGTLSLRSFGASLRITRARTHEHCATYMSRADARMSMGSIAPLTSAHECMSIDSSRWSSRLTHLPRFHLHRHFSPQFPPAACYSCSRPSQAGAA